MKLLQKLADFQMRLVDKGTYLENDVVEYDQNQIQYGYDTALVQQVSHVPSNVRKNMINLISIMARLPVKQFYPIERYKSVYLVAFVLHGRLDPVLPITHMNLGQKHNEAWARVAHAISFWEPDPPGVRTTKHHYFVEECHYHMKAVANAAMQYLAPDEADYYISEAMYSIAYPTRNFEYFKDET